MNGLRAAAFFTFALSVGCLLFGWAVPASVTFAAGIVFSVFSLRREH
ncbi:MULTISPECIES: hypothetical protein [Burkholderia cepacia complex]|nr:MULTISPECIES: hypothetical protein [Burkholderia cepacia complex]MCA8081417.1 hypothetical protein [Burkholderia cepacia]